MLEKAAFPSKKFIKISIANSYTPHRNCAIMIVRIPRENPMKILLIDDERRLCEALTAILRKNGMEATAAYDGENGLNEALTGIYDLIVLDVMLPKKNGLEVLRTLRAEQISVPVLMLSAKSEISDKICGLDLGADDYLTKPFDTGELLARIRALTRRKGEPTEQELTYGDLSLCERTHEVTCNGNSILLGRKEYLILEMLLSNPKQIIPKERFLEKIWGFDSDAEYNAIEVYLSFLRKKLTALSSRVTVRSVRGAGYRLEVQP